MKANSKLVLIKTIHTIVWTFFNIVIFYLLYAVIADQINKWVWICLTLIAVEGIILLVFKNICPITVIARRYSQSDRANFDIYLPNWLANYNKRIYTTVVLFSVVILGFRLLT